MHLSYDPAFAYFVVFCVTVICIVVLAKPTVAVAAFQLLGDVILFRFWGEHDDDDKAADAEDQEEMVAEDYEDEDAAN